MSSVDSMLLNQLKSQSLARTVIDDSPIGIRLKYIGTGTVTSVTVTTATNLILITSDGSTETFTFSTYSNLGLLADKINSSNYWECKVLDGLRTDETTNSDFVTGVKTITSAGYYDLTMDTDTCLNSSNQFIYSYRVTYDRGTGSEKPAGSHRVKLQEVVYNVNVSAAEANAFRIFEWDARAKTETQIYRKASVDATETTVNFASGEGYITAGYGNDLIIQVVDTSSITDATANFLEAVFVRE